VIIINQKIEVIELM